MSVPFDSTRYISSAQLTMHPEDLINQVYGDSVAYQGWASLPGTTTQHYFVRGRALCPRMVCWYHTGGVESRGHKKQGDCKDCRKQLKTLGGQVEKPLAERVRVEAEVVRPTAEPSAVGRGAPLALESGHRGGAAMNNWIADDYQWWLEQTARGLREEAADSGHCQEFRDQCAKAAPKLEQERAALRADGGAR